MRAVVAVLVLALGLAACSSGSQESAAGRYVEGSGATTFAPDERDFAPDVTGETLEGESLALADLDGPVVVNFWASWCGPCVREAPHLAAIAHEYEERGVHLVGVNVKDQVSNALTFERNYDIPYPSWHDEAATIAASFGGIGPAALPSTILLDAEHRVAVRLFGAVSARELTPYLEELLAEQDRARD